MRVYTVEYQRKPDLMWHVYKGLCTQRQAQYWVKRMQKEVPDWQWRIIEER